MAPRHRQRRSRKTTGQPSAAVPPVSASGAEAVAAHRTRGKGFWIGLYIAGFAAVESVLLVVFLGISGGSRERTALIQAADACFESGRTERGIEVLARIESRWPDYAETSSFRIRMGRMLVADGRNADGAEYLARFVEERPDVWDVRTEAGTAFWNAGSREEALAMFSAELGSGNPQSDTALLYLGLDGLERGDVPAALRRFQSVRDRTLLDGEPAGAIADAKRTLVKPARKAAEDLFANSSG